MPFPRHVSTNRFMRRTTSALETAILTSSRNTRKIIMYKLYLNRNESVKEYFRIPRYRNNNEQARASHGLIPA
jgi:hypothetical protein